MSIEVSDTGYLYQLILRGECGRLVAGLFGDVMIESGDGRTSMIFSVQDDSELRGLLDRIQDLGLHLVSLIEIGSIGTAPPCSVSVPLGSTKQRKLITNNHRPAPGSQALPPTHAPLRPSHRAAAKWSS